MKQLKKRHFLFYGYLWPLSFKDFCAAVSDWVTEDVLDDGTIIVRYAFSDELRYLEGSELG